MTDEAPITFDALKCNALAQDVWQALCRYAAYILHEDLLAIKGGIPNTFFMSSEITCDVPSDSLWDGQFLLFVGGEDENALSNDQLYPDVWDRMGFFRRFFSDRYHYLTLIPPNLSRDSVALGEGLRSLISKLVTPRERSLPNLKEAWQRWCELRPNARDDWTVPERWRYVTMSADAETRTRLRTQRFHGRRNNEVKRLEYTDLFLGDCLRERYGPCAPKEGTPLRVLWVDDNLETLKKKAGELDAFYNHGDRKALQIWAVSGSDPQKRNPIALFWKMLNERGSSVASEKYEKLAVGNFTPMRIAGNKTLKDPKTLEDYDLILLDLELEKHPGTIEPGRFVKGTDCLLQLMELVPEIPTFVVSNSQDPDDIEAVLTLGAQFFVPKDQVLGIVYRYYEYLIRLGEICLFISDRALRRSLIGNLRYWDFHREHLWRGDKCYHMVGHSYSHMSNVWRIVNALLAPLLKSRDDLFGDQNDRDETLYALAMATWLHDVGHSGNRQYGESHELRQLHGIISAELLLERPDLFGIHGYVDGSPPPYIGEVFAPPDTVLEVIRRRFTLHTAFEKTHALGENEPRKNQFRYRFLVEKIALLCIYHLSGCPVTYDDYQYIRRRSKKMPIGAYEKGDPLGLPITLESVVQLLGDDQKKWMLQSIGLLRFADNLDINRNRVGDETEKGHRIALQQRDMEYQLLKLRRTVEDMANQAGLPTNRRQRFMEVFFSQVVRDVRERQGVSAQTRDNQRALLNQIEADVDTHNYDMLVGFVEFIAVQDGHFDLHSAINKVHVDVSFGMGPRIVYESFLREDELENRTVKVAGQEKEKNLIEHLCGSHEKGDGTKMADGYARGEWKSCCKILRALFFDQEPTIILRCRDRNGERVKDIADTKNPQPGVSQKILGVNCPQGSAVGRSESQL